ncbi:MAG TPA: DUF47 domain-containing protein [Clostridiales bacterium]|nr:DUF47 domain-containing protein [Clostridiales bacterium]
MAKKGTDYFGMFDRCVSYANQAALLLENSFMQFNPEQLQEKMAEMHTIEHTADKVRHEMMECLAKEFLPPIDREDIVELSNAMDQVTDSIEDVLLRVYMFNIRTLRPDVQEFVTIIRRCCQTLQGITQELPHFRKSQKLRGLLVDMNDLEGEGDRLYTQVMRRLYDEEKDPVSVFAWTALYDRMERCCDRCEEVAEAVERVVMKNS